MADHDPYEHESYAAMCKRTDAALAAVVASSTRMEDPQIHKAELLPETQAAEAELPAIEKNETSTEIWKRISQQREARLVKSVKTAAKKSVKQRKIRKISHHFARK